MEFLWAQDAWRYSSYIPARVCITLFYVFSFPTVFGSNSGSRQMDDIISIITILDKVGDKRMLSAVKYN